MRKLLKYEMRAMNRRLFPVYLGTLAIAVLNYFFGFGIILRGSDSLTTDMIYSLPEGLQILVLTLQSIITALFFALMIGMLVVWLLKKEWFSCLEMPLVRIEPPRTLVWKPVAVALYS